MLEATSPAADGGPSTSISRSISSNRSKLSLMAGDPRSELYFQSSFNWTPTEWNFLTRLYLWASSRSDWSSRRPAIALLACDWSHTLNPRRMLPDLLTPRGVSKPCHGYPLAIRSGRLDCPLDESRIFGIGNQPWTHGFRRSGAQQEVPKMSQRIHDFSATTFQTVKLGIFAQRAVVRPNNNARLVSS